MKRAFATVLCGLALSACNVEESATAQQRRQQERLSKESNVQVGMPSIRNFREKRILRMLYELRDTEITTYAYVKNMDGSLSFICQALGFGLPYATQFTNPQMATYSGSSGVATLPQADPNGLFSPSASEASWIMCVDPSDHKTKPVYVEERMIVSPFPLKASTSFMSETAPAPRAVAKP